MDIPTKLPLISKNDIPHVSRDFCVFSRKAEYAVPVTFLTNLDVIGGNSGSPVLNGDGEIVGLVSDRSYESMIAEFAYFPDLTRTVCVDIHYVLFLTEKFAEASHIPAELSIR